MLPYWLLFLVPAIAVLQERPGKIRTMRRKPTLIGATLLLTVMIGFRHEVGADWGAYLRYLDRSSYMSFTEVFGQSDPGYILLNWLAAQTFGEIWAANLLCGLLFSIGLVTFARAQPRPWLTLLVATPYLVIVVAMGYSRQGVAIGLAMLGFVALTRDRSTVKFVIWITLAAAFHKTALLLVPVAALSVDRGRIWTACWVGGATVLLYYLYLEDSVDHLMTLYIEREMESQGTAIRIAMNALPAVIFLLGRQRFHLTHNERKLWTNMALIGLAFIAAFVVSPSSTAVDRMALYFVPLQFFVLPRLPDAYPMKEKGLSPVTLGIVGYSAAVLFIWLNFATHAHAWLPYQFYPLL